MLSVLLRPEEEEGWITSPGKELSCTDYLWWVLTPHLQKCARQKSFLYSRGSWNSLWLWGPEPLDLHLDIAQARAGAKLTASLGAVFSLLVRISLASVPRSDLTAVESLFLGRGVFVVDVF